MKLSFQRYLAAKRTVDDRALNQSVWQSLRHQVRILPASPLQMLEIGAGIGTMVERLLDWGLVDAAFERPIDYTAIDEQAKNIATARQRLAQMPATWSLRLQTADLFDFVKRKEEWARYDLLIAHAFLDLVDIPKTLPQLLQLLKPNGLVYFTINFDGVTSLQPAIDPPFDGLIETLYHRSMDERISNGVLSGDSRSGRHMFAHLHNAGVEILAAGSSDWVVFAKSNGYPGDEAYFLHFIVNTMHGALGQHGQLDQARFAAWIEQRHRQIESGELVYIAHQIDFLGVKSEVSVGQ